MSSLQPGEQVGGLVLGVFQSWFLLLLVFFVVLVLLVVWVFFKNVHLRKNLGYLRAGTKPKVCQMTDIYNKALYAHLHLNSGSYCKLPTQAFISVV